MVAGEDVPSRSQPPLTHTFLMAAEVQQEGGKKVCAKEKKVHIVDATQAAIELADTTES